MTFGYLCFVHNNEKVNLERFDLLVMKQYV